MAKTSDSAPRPHALENYAADYKALVDILGADRALATLAAAEDGGLTVDQLAERFFDWKAGDVTPRTLADYRRDYDNWTRPALGSRLADSVDELDVQRLVDEMRQRLEPKSVADRHMLLFSMFKFGSTKTRRLVGHNPCLETQLPKRTKKPVKGATLAEYHAIITAARAVDPDAADLIEFIAGTGWRWSEAAALRVGNVEQYEEDGVTHTSAVMTAVFRKDAAQRQIRTDDAAKSDAGFRRSRLSPRVARMVERRCVGRGPAELMFTNAAGRKWYQQNFLSRTWTAILDRAGLERRVTPHALRHSHVAMLDRAKASMPEIQRRIGHENIQTTIGTYGGMIDQIGDEALVAIDRMLEPPSTPAGEVVPGEVVEAEPMAIDDGQPSVTLRPW
jgi:integrase